MPKKVITFIANWILKLKMEYPVPVIAFRLIHMRMMLTGLLLFGFGSLALGQIHLKGTLTDAETGDPLTFGVVSIIGTDIGDLTDSFGNFSIKTDLNKGILRFSAQGYEKKEIKFHGEQTFLINLKPSINTIGEVSVIGQKGRYKNKDNPAVALIKKVIENKANNYVQDYDHVQFKKYEKLSMYWENPSFLRGNFLTQKYDFIFQNLDTITQPGKALLPLYLEENVYRHYSTNNPKRKNEVLEAKKQVTFNKRYVNNGTLGEALKYLNQEIDLYQNNLYIFTTDFMSPINNLAPQFYKFYIQDTIYNPYGGKMVKLNFEPRNPQDLLLSGDLYVALNGKYSLIEAHLTIPSNANINWINGTSLELDYRPNESGNYYLRKSKMGTEIGLNDFGLKDLKTSIYLERTTVTSEVDTKSPISADKFVPQSPDSVEIETLKQDKDYWTDSRPEVLNPFEQQAYYNMDSLNRMRSFDQLISWISFITGGYKYVYPVEIGPFGEVASFNSVEGLRLQVGGRTTPDFSKFFYFSGDVAYGFQDRRWKYFVDGAFAFNKVNPFYGYPHHYFKVTSAFDLQLPGRDIQSIDESNILLSFKRGEDPKYLYNRLLRFNYINELLPHVRFNLEFENWEQTTTPGFFFLQRPNTPNEDTLKGIAASAVGLAIRWAPHEKFLKGRGAGRTTLINKYPIFEGEVRKSFKGLFGGHYDFTTYRLSIQKRFFLSQLGFVETKVEGGLLTGKVPYPLLFIPRANQTYEMQTGSFNLMNYMEFLTDQYTTLSIDYHMKGFLFNKIPYLNRLRFREVAGFRAMYGDLSNPNQGELAQLPPNYLGQISTFHFTTLPYMEFNVGIENILNLFRVDYVQRISYLNHPDISRRGIRFSANFTF